MLGLARARHSFCAGSGRVRGARKNAHIHTYFSASGGWAHDGRYIIAKSTTKTVVPSPIEGRAQMLNTSVSGSSQFKDVSAEPQFPFEIYHKSSSLYFDRSDGDITTSVEVTSHVPLLISS